MYSKLASAIYNDIIGGLAGYTSTPNISMEQLIDDIIDERLQIIREYTIKGIIPRNDLLQTINCVNIDCKSMNACPCVKNSVDNLTMHFEIPQVIDNGIEYIGSIDKQNSFVVYTNIIEWNYNKYRKRGKNHATVFVDTTPNKNNKNDCWVFNAPLLSKVSIIAIFKDLNQLQEYGCCSEDEEINNMSFINNEIKRRLTEKKLRFYRQLAAQTTPNTQAPK